jgi:hypothetical protein
MTAILPSLNLNGIVIRTMTVTVTSGASPNGTNVYADAVAPTPSPTDYSKRIIFGAGGGASVTALSVMPYPIYLYPGQGLWAQTGGTIGYLFCTYDILSPDVA